MAVDSTQGAKSRRNRYGTGAPPLLVEAKLAAPNMRRGIVDRPRIREALDAGDEAALTLVAAPAGYGKTIAVRGWCASLNAALAWVTLDDGDNDPAQLWRYVATAVDRVRSGLGRGALQRLSVPGSAIEDAVDELMNGITALGGRLVLVLDDLQAVTNQECLSSIDHALAHVPATARAVILTRVDPTLSLAGLRAGGALAELRTNELAFTTAEARELLVVRGRIELGAEEIDLLVKRTEGWPAALVLAGLWLQTVEDPARAVRAFGGDHRFVAEYLSNEVLASLDDDRRSLLHGAAVLGELTAELCDAALGRTDAEAELAELERSNLFISPLERGGWFRVHSLFAEYARAQLASSEPAAVAQIHRRAAEWLRSRRLPVDAVEHAAAAGDHKLVAEVLLEYHLPLIRNGASRTLLRWVGTLPDDHVVEHPELAVAAAAAAVLVGGSTIEQRRLLRLADRALGQDDRADPYVGAAARMVRALTIDGGVAQAVLDGRRAVELAQHWSDEVITGALAAYARALYFAGDLKESSAVAMQVLEHPDADHRAPSVVHVRTTLALVAVERGRLAVARNHAEKAKALAGRIGTSRSWLGANASAALGAVLVAEGTLVDAEHELATAEHFFRDEVATLHQAWLLVLLARVRVHRGRLDEAEKTLRTAQQAVDELTDSGLVPALADCVEQELETAEARAQGGELLAPPSEAELAVLRLMATDLSTREIGERLFISPNTVRSHVRSLYQKLGVHSRPDAIARATMLELLEQAESPR
jgi:LuxR family transcriptional regulator, maltose regulon positive regulatory protein